MVLELYQNIFSPPSRAVMMFGKLLKLPIEMKTVNLMEGEQEKPEFLKINPFHCVPTLVDDGFALWESRAIMTYLVNRYAPGNDLYPSDLKARATVDRWLYWDIGSLYATLSAYIDPILLEKAKPDPIVAQQFKDKVKQLDEALVSSKYLCGNKLTLADISMMTTITTAKGVDLDLKEFKNVDRWLKQLQRDLPSWTELVTEPSQAFGQLLKG